jgi:hypothetical protein
MIKFDDFTNKYLKIFMKKRSNVIFPKLKKMRSDISNYIKNNEIKFKIEEYVIPEKKLHTLIDTQWVYKEVLNSIKDLHANYKISWSYKNFNHCIFIKSTESKFNSFKERLDTLLHIINYIYDSKKTSEEREINMYLLLSPLKKIIEKDDTICPKNINSGYTDFSTNEIFIWREEEFEKVIFHELIHYMDLDVRNMAFDDEDIPIIINGPKSYYEAFTDLQGILYYLVYLSIVTGKSVNSFFQIEYEFIKNQANNLNNIFKLEDWSTLAKSEPTNKEKKIIKQSSPAFTYFIIKYLIIKKIVEDNNINLLNNPKELIKTIFNIGFISESCIDIKSSRMTLIQMY